MRLPLECARPLKHDLTGHDVEHVVDRGWSSKRNGELLTLMVAERFDAFLTVDQNIEFQQNLSGRAIGVVVVRARTNRLRELRPLVPDPRSAGEAEARRTPQSRPRRIVIGRDD
jgi:hypothetical protein